MENVLKTVFATILTALAFALGLVYVPVISFIFGYIGGIILNWIVGAQLTNGLNLIFDTTRFTRESLPLVLATVSAVCSYFVPIKSDK